MGINVEVEVVVVVVEDLFKSRGVVDAVAVVELAVYAVVAVLVAECGVVDALVTLLDAVD